MKRGNLILLLVVLAVGALPEIKRPTTTEMDAGAPPRRTSLIFPNGLHGLDDPSGPGGRGW